VGVEVLLRWNHPIRGLVSPVEFIDPAEATGLILPISDLLVSKARDQLAIDDFGTGHGSLAAPERLPVDRVKIDRAFMHRIDEPGVDIPCRRAASCSSFASVEPISVLSVFPCRPPLTTPATPPHATEPTHAPGSRQREQARIAGWKRQVGLSFWWILLGIPSMAAAVAIGHADGRLIALWAPLSVLVSAFTWWGLRRGWTLGLKDPALTLPQIAYSIASTAACYAMLGPMRAMVLPMTCLALLFSIFALPPRQVRGLAIYALLLFAVVMSGMAWQQPQRYPWAEEVATFWLLLVVVPGFAVLAGRMSALRNTLGRQKTELAQALARIADIADRDELTGLANRRRAQERLQLLQDEAARGKPAFLAIIDLDHFKQVNDVHGHAVGDMVLRRFAQETTGLLRPGDLLARWGGEEFLLVVETLDTDVALALCERVRQHTAAFSVPIAERGELRITVSIGVSRHTADGVVAQTLAAADAALYRAKASGRNRVELQPAAGIPVGSGNGPATDPAQAALRTTCVAVSAAANASRVAPPLQRHCEPGTGLAGVVEASPGPDTADQVRRC